MRYLINNTVYFTPLDGGLESKRTGEKLNVPKIILLPFRELLNRQGDILEWSESIEICTCQSVKISYLQSQFGVLRRRLFSLGVERNFILTVQCKGLQINNQHTITLEPMNLNLPSEILLS